MLFVLGGPSLVAATTPRQKVDNFFGGLVENTLIFQKVGVSRSNPIAVEVKETYLKQAPSPKGHLDHLLLLFRGGGVAQGQQNSSGTSRKSVEGSANEKTPVPANAQVRKMHVLERGNPSVPSCHKHWGGYIVG